MLTDPYVYSVLSTTVNTHTVSTPEKKNAI